MRVKGGYVARRRRKRVLDLASGQYGNRKSNFRFANVCVMKALQYAYDHRRKKKGDMRALWIARIGAAVREIGGINYSKFIHGWFQACYMMQRLSVGTNSSERCFFSAIPAICHTNHGFVFQSVLFFMR
jgi:large subunit ribosomal protein L20